MISFAVYFLELVKQVKKMLSVSLTATTGVNFLMFDLTLQLGPSKTFYSITFWLLLGGVANFFSLVKNLRCSRV